MTRAPFRQIDITRAVRGAGLPSVDVQRKIIDQRLKLLEKGTRIDKINIIVPMPQVVDQNGCIYVISNGECVKIGFSTNIKNRVRSLQTGSSDRLVILFSVDGTINDERLLHERFSRYRLVGEWFRVDGHLKTWIDRNTMRPKV